MSDSTPTTDRAEVNVAGAEAPFDWEATSRHPLKSVSIREIELAIAMALQGLAPRAEHEYKVSIGGIEFSKTGGFLETSADMQLTVRHGRPIGDLAGDDIFGKRT